MNRQSRNRILWILAFLAGGLWLAALSPWKGIIRQRMTGNRATRWLRPYGMAPVAFNAFLKACEETHIQPDRIGQTIGDYPLSFGYHKRDGVLVVKGERIDYCAAVDLGANGLDRVGIDFFLHNLTKRGFACWYREEGKWKGKEHINAVYALLPMKPQLQGQVRLFLRERRANGIKPLLWERQAVRLLGFKRRRNFKP